MVDSCTPALPPKSRGSGNPVLEAGHARRSDRSAGRPLHQRRMATSCPLTEGAPAPLG